MCTVTWLSSSTNHMHSASSIPHFIFRRPVWARGRCRISPPRFLADCCKRQLNQGSFVLLYFTLFTFSDLYWVCLSVFSCTVLFVSISQVIGCEDRLRNDLYCVEWGVKLYSNQPILFSAFHILLTPGYSKWARLKEIGTSWSHWCFIFLYVPRFFKTRLSISTRDPNTNPDPSCLPHDSDWCAETSSPIPHLAPRHRHLSMQPYPSVRLLLCSISPTSVESSSRPRHNSQRFQNRSIGISIRRRCHQSSV